MPVLPPSLFEALDADPSLWPGPLSVQARAELERMLGALPAEVRDAVVSAIVDPERNRWSRATVQGITLAGTAGAKPVGLLTDDVIEMVDAREERFGLVPIGFRLPADPCGPKEDVERLLEGLDQTFAHRRYVLYLRRPVPAGVDVAPICKAVQLWLGQVDRHDRAELHAFYEDDDVAIDLTVVDSRPTPGDRPGGRILTVRPLESLERLASVDTQLVEAASRSEESIGSLPLVMVASADRPWRLPRGFVQWLLLGTPDVVVTERGPEGLVHEATFTPNGRYESLFVDPSCRTIAALWWTESLPLDPDDPLHPLQFAGRAYDNPWAAASPALAVRVPRFTPQGEPDRKRTVVMRWES